MTEMFLIGHHIAHSLSPAMWNHVFERTGRDLRYGRRDVSPDELGPVLHELRTGDVLAANVTMPHKAWAAGIADGLSEVAAATGAVNLLIPERGSLYGTNTDVPGARGLLEPHGPYDVVVVLGAGGTATALLEALVGLAARIVITNRTRDRADTLAGSYARRFASVGTVDWSDRHGALPEAALIVNTVPVVDESPIDLAGCRSDVRVYDVMYRSEPTALQRHATARGIPLADGLAHLAAQAIAMLEPLRFAPEESALLIEGLEKATSRRVTAWGDPL